MKVGLNLIELGKKIEFLDWGLCRKLDWCMGTKIERKDLSNLLKDRGG